jgi:hypothetical protein
MTTKRPHTPNAETVAAMESAQRGEGKSFATVEELMADLNAPEPPVDLFEFTSLFPISTNLPVTIWISVHGFVTTDPYDPGASKPPAVSAWVEHNRETLLAYWAGRIDSVEMAQALQPLPR